MFSICESPHLVISSKEQSFVFTSHIIKHSLVLALEVQLNTEASNPTHNNIWRKQLIWKQIYLEINITDDVNYEDSINFDSKWHRLKIYQFY